MGPAHHPCKWLTLSVIRLAALDPLVIITGYVSVLIKESCVVARPCRTPTGWDSGSEAREPVPHLSEPCFLVCTMRNDKTFLEDLQLCLNKVNRGSSTFPAEKREHLPPPCQLTLVTSKSMDIPWWKWARERFLTKTN